MSLNDPLANALSIIMNYEKIARQTCIIKPVSSVIKKVLELMNQSGYVGGFKGMDDGKGGYVEVSLLGKINNCGVIKPRFYVKSNGYIKFEKRYLPSRDFGIILVSTSKGIMTHTDAKKNNLGGTLIAYCY